MNHTRWTISLALILAGVLFLSAPALAQPWSGWGGGWGGGKGAGPRWQDNQSAPQAQPAGYRNCPNYPRYQNCPWGNTPQGPRGPRPGGRDNAPNPPATPSGG